MKYINKFIIIAFLIILMLPYSSVLAAPLPKHQIPQKQTTKPSSQRSVQANGDTYSLDNSGNYNIRIDGATAGDILSYGGITESDINNNGKPDIIISTNNASYSGSNSGSIYIIYDNLLSSITGTGNTINLSNSTNYNLRYDGANAGDHIYAAFASDIDNDSKPDLLISSPSAGNNSKSYSGSFYIIYNNLITSHTGTGNNIDLNNSSNYNIRYDGGSNYDYISYAGFNVSDINNDNKSDIIVGGEGDYGSRSANGVVYIIYNNLIVSHTGTGNNIDLTTSSNYNIRIIGASDGDYFGGEGDLYTTDLDGDGKQDLVSNSPAFGNPTGGYLYVIYNNLITSHTGTGNTIDLALSTSYNLRFNSAVNEDLGYSDISRQLKEVDINNNGKNDLVIPLYNSDNNSRTDSGSLYIIFDSIIRSYSGTGNNIPLSNPSNYNIRYDGELAGDNFSLSSIFLGDIYNLGKVDIAVGSFLNNPSNVYVLSNSLINTYTSTGNNVDLANSSNYSYKYSQNSQYLGTEAINFLDLNKDGSNDLLIGNGYSDNNSRTDSGSVYIVYNYPHTITSSVISPVKSDTLNLTGNVAAPNSVTNIKTAEYKLDSGTWSSCSASDGTFNSKSENFGCSLSSLTSGLHIVNIRSTDDKGTYTPSSMYKTVNFSVLPTPTESKVVVEGDNTTITTRKPTISGVNTNAKTIEVQSTLQTYTVTPDSLGNWNITVTNSLEDGTHTVTVKNSSGTVLSTTTFTVQSNEPYALLAETGQNIMFQFILGPTILGVTAFIYLEKKLKN